MAEVTSVRTVDYMKTCKACGSSWDTKQTIDRCPFCGADLREKITVDSIESVFKLILERHGQNVFYSNILLGLLGDYAPSLIKERNLVKIAIESGAYKAICTVSVEEREHELNKYVSLLTESYFIDEMWARKVLMWCVDALDVESSISGGSATGNGRTTTEAGGSATGTNTTKNTVIYAPMNGKAVKLATVPDEAFASGMLGLGVAIDPTEGKLYAPFDGTVICVAEAKHAYMIRNAAGAEVLIHIGVDSARLNGKYFTPKIVNGQKVGKGDLLAEFDINAIKKEYKMFSPVILVNVEDYSTVEIVKDSGLVKVGDVLFYAKKTVNQGDKDTQYNRGCMYLEGRGVPRDYQKAYVCFKEAAGQGNLDAINKVGYMYDNGYGVTQNYQKAYDYYKKAADSGNRAAQYNLGKLYQNGIGVQQNYTMAVKWFEKAAEQGYSSAQRELGILYRTGNGVSQDYQKAYKYYKKAADQRDTGSMNDLGFMYENGYGVPQDYQKAYAYYKKAADSGNMLAQYNLGYSFKNGDCVQQDYVKAAEWFEKAAEQGYSGARRELGHLYRTGNGVSKDYLKAYEYYKKAADSGHRSAQYNVGKMYRNGCGVSQNYQKAYGVVS